MAMSQVAASGRLESVDRGRTVTYTGAAGRRGGPWRPAESEGPRDRIFVDADARGSPSDPPGGDSRTRVGRAYFGERAERRNEQRFERIEAAIEAVARESQRRDERIEATLETVVRDVRNLAVDVAFLAGRQAERDAADAED